MAKTKGFFNIKDPGWCTPTILVGILGLLGIIALSVQLGTNKDKTKNQGLIIALVTKILWTMVIVGLLFCLCSNGKLEAAWWIFGIFYILPVALLFFALSGWFYVDTKEKKIKK